MSALDDVNTLSQAAAYLKKPEPKVRRLALDGKLGYLKTGRDLTFPRAALEAFVADNTTLPLPPNKHGLTDASLKRISRGLA